MVRKNTANGFTLIELLIAMVIVGILAAIALPSFTESVRKGRRGDAVAALQRVQQAQERYRANNTNYAADFSDTGLNMSSGSPDGHYTVSVTSVSATRYTATATPAAGSPQASDTRCTTLSLTQDRGTITYSSTGSAAGDGTRNPCWNR